MFILSFDECALSVLLIFIVLSIIRREYNTRTNILLNLIMWAIFISTLCDLISAHISNTATAGTDAFTLIVYAVNYLYFMAHNSILPIYVLYLYSSVDIWDYFVRNKVLKFTWLAITAINYVALALNGLVINIFSVNSNSEYTRGPWIFIFYLVAAIWIVWLLKVLYKYKRLINAEKVHILSFIFVVIIVGLILQFIDGKFLVEGFTMALSVLFFMMMVKREDRQINPISGALVYSEGINRVTRNIKINKPMNFIFFKISNNASLHMYLGTEGYNSFLAYITKNLNAIAKENGYHGDLFYMENGLFSFMGTDLEYESVNKTAQMAVERLYGENKLDSFTVLLDCSVCVVYYPEDVEDFSTLLTLATSFQDNTEKYKLLFYGQLKNNKDFRVKNELEEIIKRGLEHNGFRMYYQPIYSISERRFVAAEALIRLKDKSYGFISPGIFIPAAENCGLIHEIGDFVLNEVTKFISDYDIDEFDLDYIEMNLSNSQCIETNLYEKIRDLFEERSISPEKIGFGITESATDVNPDSVDNNIHRLHDMGVRIALDGYGTGYSNIKRLTRLPIDQIKLDKKFVDMIDEPNMLIVIQETITMLKEMGKEILVEGVEDEMIARKFTGMGADLIQGCEFIQGFYFCQPLPKDEFVEFLRTHQKRKDMY